MHMKRGILLSTVPTSRSSQVHMRRGDTLSTVLTPESPQVHVGRGDTLEHWPHPSRSPQVHDPIGPSCWTSGLGPLSQACFRQKQEAAHGRPLSPALRPREERFLGSSSHSSFTTCLSLPLLCRGPLLFIRNSDVSCNVRLNSQLGIL